MTQDDKHAATPEKTPVQGVVDDEYQSPSGDNPDPHHIYIDEVQGHQRRFRKIIEFTNSSTRAAVMMLVAAIIALIVANTAAHEPFLEFWHTYVVVGVGPFVGEMSLAHIINDIAMAIFFLLVGLEIKYEMTVGELTDLRQAALPIIAACGGVLAPIGFYMIFNAGHPDTAMGWGVPTATDIAFALGIMALLGNRVPNGVKVFLSTLAVADDIIAILVIAIFYGESPDFGWLLGAVGIVIILCILNKMHVYALAPYLLIGIVLWYCVFMSGIHSTIAGVALAFTIPTESRVRLSRFLGWSDARLTEAAKVYDADAPITLQHKYMDAVSMLSRVAGQVVPPATRLEHKLYPWVYFLILPLFALTNADVAFLTGDASVGEMMTSPIFFGVFCGLVLGKPCGIMLFSWLTVKFKIASLPENVNWIHMLGAGILGGVGFTMAIFVANLAYTSEVYIADAKLAILCASACAGVIGFLFLMMQAKAAERHGVTFSDDSDYLDEGEEPMTEEASAAVLDEVVREANREFADVNDDISGSSRGSDNGSWT